MKKPSDKNKYTADELISHMQTWDIDNLPDGAWFATLEAGGESFIRLKKLGKHLDGNDLAHEYLSLISERK